MLFEQAPIARSSTPTIRPSATSATAAAGRVITYGLDGRCRRARLRHRRAAPTAPPSTSPPATGPVASTCSCRAASTSTTRWRRMALAAVEGIDLDLAAARARGGCRRAGADGDRRPGPAVRRRRRLCPHGRLAGQGAARPAPAGARAADRRLRLGGGARSDQAPGHGRAWLPSWPTSRSSPTKTRAWRIRSRSTRRSPRARALPARAMARRCSSSTTARRRSAHAIGLAQDGDVILLAGKGHEKTIIYGTEGRWWDEKEVARRALRDAGYGGTACLTCAPGASTTATPGTPSSSPRPYRSFPQLWEWGELREAFGWQCVADRGRRGSAAAAGGRRAGAAAARVRALGWRLAYVPRGPVGHLDEPRVREALIAAPALAGADARAWPPSRSIRRPRPTRHSARRCWPSPGGRRRRCSRRDAGHRPRASRGRAARGA